MFSLLTSVTEWSIINCLECSCIFFLSFVWLLEKNVSDEKKVQMYEAKILCYLMPWKTKAQLVIDELNKTVWLRCEVLFFVVGNNIKHRIQKWFFSLPFPYFLSIHMKDNCLSLFAPLLYPFMVLLLVLFMVSERMVFRFYSKQYRCCWSSRASWGGRGQWLHNHPVLW